MTTCSSPSLHQPPLESFSLWKWAGRHCMEANGHCMEASGQRRRERTAPRWREGAKANHTLHIIDCHIVIMLLIRFSWIMYSILNWYIFFLVFYPWFGSSCTVIHSSSNKPQTLVKITSTPPWGPSTGKLDDRWCQWADLKLTNIEILHRQSGMSVIHSTKKQFVSEPHAEIMDCWHSHLEPSQSSLSRCCHMHSPTVLLDTTPPHDVWSTQSHYDHRPPQSFCSECWGQSASIKASQPL